MKNYKQLVKSLPSKTVVFAFGRFNPPTTGHELLIKAVKKLAANNNAAHAIYASKTQNTKKDPLPVDKKIQYLNMLFPGTNFVAASAEVASFIQAAEQLNKKYKNLIMVAGSDRVPEYTRILNTYNGKNFNFDSIQVISAGERDPDADNASGMSATKMRTAAAKGEYADFKKGLPSHVRDIDAKRLMNDVRLGLGLEVIKEQIKFNVDTIREQYFQGNIFLEGQIVESAGIHYTIVKRGSNHLLVEDKDGNKMSKWIKDVNLVDSNITPTIGAAMNEELTTKTIKPTDKLKVARMIASFLGNEDAEKSSNPENLVNMALRKVKTKITHSDSRAMLTKMLSLADEVGIDYDKTLLPVKMKEANEPRVVPVNTKSKRNAGGDILSLKDFNKLSKLNKGITEQADDEIGDTADGSNEIKLTDPEGSKVAPHQVPHTKVGHSLTYPDNDTNRRMKVKYKTEEVDLTEVSTAKAREVHAARVDQYNKAKKSGDDEATEKAKGKMKSSFKHYLNKDTKDTKKMFDKLAPKGDEAIKKAANDEHEYNKSRGWSNEEVELDEAQMKMSYKDWLKQTGKTHSPENTELYKKTQTEELKKKQMKTPVRDDSYQLGVNNGKGFDAFFEEVEEDDCTEDELESMANSINDVDDVMDAYDDDELAIVDDEGEEIHSSLKEEVEALNEVLSRLERIKAKVRFARTQSKRERKIQIALKRHSDTKTLNNRARKLAIVLMKKRLAKKPLDKLSVGEKERIEGIIQRRKTAINRLAMKMVPRVRKIEQDRLAHKKYTKA